MLKYFKTTLINYKREIDFTYREDLVYIMLRNK